MFDLFTLLLLLEPPRLCTWRSRLCEKAESNTCRDDRRPGLLRNEQVSAGLSRDLRSARCGSNRQQPCVTASKWAVITAVQEAKMFSCRDETRQAHTNTSTHSAHASPRSTTDNEHLMSGDVITTKHTAACCWLASLCFFSSCMSTAACS